MLESWVAAQDHKCLEVAVGEGASEADSFPDQPASLSIAVEKSKASAASRSHKSKEASQGKKPAKPAAKAAPVAKRAQSAAGVKGKKHAKATPKAKAASRGVVKKRPATSRHTFVRKSRMSRASRTAKAFPGDSCTKKIGYLRSLSPDFDNVEGYPNPMIDVTGRATSNVTANHAAIRDLAAIVAPIDLLDIMLEAAPIGSQITLPLDFGSLREIDQSTVSQACEITFKVILPKTNGVTVSESQAFEHRSVFRHCETM